MASEDSRNRDRCLRFIVSRDGGDLSQSVVVQVLCRSISAGRERTARSRDASRFSMGVLRRTARPIANSSAVASR